MQDQLTTVIEQAIETRFEFGFVDINADPNELHNALVNMQTLLDSLERYLSQVIRAKSSADRRTAKARMVWQEKWDTAITKVNNRPSLSEYATGKEKAAEANLATFNEARELRQEEELHSFASEAVDIVRLHYYGLDKVRQDLRKRLDFSQTEYMQSA